MKKFLSDKMRTLGMITVLFGFFVIYGCEVVVQVSKGPSSSDGGGLPPVPQCGLTETHLTIKGYEQEEGTGWCWAASAQMVINYLLTLGGQNPIEKQCDIVDAVLGHPPDTCCGMNTTTAPCNVEGWPEDVFDKKGFTYSPPQKDPQDKQNLWAKITNQICIQKPIIISQYFIGGLGHTAVIYGYRDGGEENRWVDLYDHLVPPATDPLSGDIRELEQVSYDNELYFVPDNDALLRTSVYYTWDIEFQ